MSRQSRLMSALGVAAVLATTLVAGTGTALAADTTAPTVRIAAPNLNPAADSDVICPEFIDPIDPSRLLISGKFGLHAEAADAESGIGNVQFLYDYWLPGESLASPAPHRAVSAILTEEPWFAIQATAFPQDTILDIRARAENGDGLVTISSPLRVRISTAVASGDSLPAGPDIAIPSEERAGLDNDGVSITFVTKFSSKSRTCGSATADLADVQAVYYYAKEVGSTADPIIIMRSFKSPFDEKWDPTSALPPQAGHTYDVHLEQYGLRGTIVQGATKRLTVVQRTGETIPPTVAITSPAEGTVFNDPAATTGFAMQATVTATDNTGVSHVDLFDNGTFIARDTSAPYNFSWSSTVLGEHTLTAKAVDVEGNEATSDEHIVFVDGPTVDIDGGFLDAFVLTFSQAVDIPDDSLITLREHDSGRVLDTFLECEPSCDAAIEVFVITTTEYLLAGQRYDVIIDPEVVAENGAPVTPSVLAARGPQVINDDSPTVQQRWRVSTISAALGGSFLSEHLPGASLSYFFSGNKITWYSTQGPAFGKANVFIDGKIVAIVNNGASRTSFRVPVFTRSLSSGRHVITIQVRGEKGLLSGVDSLVAVDGFGVQAGVDANPHVFTTWREVTHGSALAGQFSESDSRGSAAVFYFRGTAIDWYTVTSYTMGRAHVVIDGVVRAVVDNYTPGTAFRVRRRFTVPDGVHKFEVRPLQEKNPAGKAAKVAVDMFVVG